MPQFDIFFYFNAILYFMTSFVLMYFVLSFYLLPRLLSTLKIRKQKLDFLYKINFLSSLRVKFLDLNLFARNLKLFSVIVKCSLIRQ